jgi:hypothetical protein
VPNTTNTRKNVAIASSAIPFAERDVERQRLAAEPCAHRGFVREDPQERVRRERRPEELRDDEEHRHHRLDASRREEAERHRGIQVPGDAHRRRDHDGEDEPVRRRDDEEHVLHARHLRRHDRGAPDEDEGEDPDELRGEVAPAVAHRCVVRGAGVRLRLRDAVARCAAQLGARTTYYIPDAL